MAKETQKTLYLQPVIKELTEEDTESSIVVEKRWDFVQQKLHVLSLVTKFLDPLSLFIQQKDQMVTVDVESEAEKIV